MKESVKDFLQEWRYLIDEERKQQTNKTEIRLTPHYKDDGVQQCNDIIEFEFPKW